MGDCCNMYGRRPDGQLCDRLFQKFRWKSFLFKSRVRTVRHWRPDSRMSATSNFHIRLRASGPRGMCASGPWEADVQTVEVESAISMLVACASRPRMTDVRTVIFELRFLPYLWARSDGKPHRPDNVSIFPYSELGKNLKLIDHWWTSGRAVEMSGRMQAGTEASRYSGGSRRKDTSSGWMMLVCLAFGRGWHVVWTDGIVDRWASGRDDMSSGRDDMSSGRDDMSSGRDDMSSGRLTGNLKSSIFFAMQSLLKMLWQVESLFTTSLHISYFVQTQNEAKILTNSPIGKNWDKNHLTGLEIHSRYKNKNYSPFLSQRDKG
jgi:hypothetical protein